MSKTKKTTTPTARAGYRLEEDLLGTMEVPNDAYYGIHTLRAIDNFTISRTTINHVPEFIRGMVQVKKATALANRRLHTLPAKKCEAIVWACDQILDKGRCMDQFPIDVFQGGAGTSLNMNTNEVIANLALEYLGEPKGNYSVINPNDDVNMSQSTTPIPQVSVSGFMLRSLNSSNKLTNSNQPSTPKAPNSSIFSKWDVPNFKTPCP